MRKIISEDGRTTLFPDDGMVLTNGETYGEVEVKLAIGMTDDGWYEITTEEYEEILAQKLENSDENVLMEKARAYDIMMGVSQ
jgi:hypothetical protein